MQKKEPAKMDPDELMNYIKEKIREAIHRKREQTKDPEKDYNTILKT